MRRARVENTAERRRELLMAKNGQKRRRDTIPSIRRAAGRCSRAGAHRCLQDTRKKKIRAPLLASCEAVLVDPDKKCFARNVQRRNGIAVEPANMSGTLSRVRYPRPGCRMRISLTSGLTISGKPIHDHPGDANL